MRIDSHQHFTPEYSPELLRPILKRNRFDATVLVGSDLSPGCQGVATDYVRAVVIDADLASRELPDLLDAWQRETKFRGVRSAFDGVPRGLAELIRHDLTLDLPPRPELVPAIAERFPSLRIALDHVGQPSLMNRPFDEWARDLERAAQHPLLYVKISGLITDAPTRWQADQFRPVVRQALRTFGPERVMYGSDWPTYLPEGTWKEALAAFTQSIGAMPTEIRELLLGANAARFYRIDPGAAA